MGFLPLLGNVSGIQEVLMEAAACSTVLALPLERQQTHRAKNAASCVPCCYRAAGQHALHHHTASRACSLSRRRWWARSRASPKFLLTLASMAWVALPSSRSPISFRAETSPSSPKRTSLLAKRSSALLPSLSRVFTALRIASRDALSDQIPRGLAMVSKSVSR